MVLSTFPELTDKRFKRSSSLSADFLRAVVRNFFYRGPGEESRDLGDIQSRDRKAELFISLPEGEGGVGVVEA